MITSLEIHKKCMKFEDNIFEIAKKYGREEALEVLSFLLYETEFYNPKEYQNECI